MRFPQRGTLAAVVAGCVALLLAACSPDDSEQPSAQSVDAGAWAAELEHAAADRDAARTRLAGTAARAADEGNPGAEADAYLGLGDLERDAGNFEAARAAYDSARFAAQAGRDLRTEALALARLGETEQGRDLDARRRFAEARALIAEGEDPVLDGWIQLGIGRLDRRIGRADEPRSAYLAALGNFADNRSDVGAAHALLALGDLDRDLGDTDAALDFYAGALDLFVSAGDRNGEAEARMGIGEVLRTIAPDRAGVEFQAAARLFALNGFAERSVVARAAAESLP